MGTHQEKWPQSTSAQAFQSISSHFFKAHYSTRKLYRAHDLWLGTQSKSASHLIALSDITFKGLVIDSEIVFRPKIRVFLWLASSSLHHLLACYDTRVAESVLQETRNKSFLEFPGLATHTCGSFLCDFLATFASFVFSFIANSWHPSCCRQIPQWRRSADSDKFSLFSPVHRQLLHF
jgi:hypothetical protein